MKISEETKYLVNEINDFSKSPLKNLYEVSVLIEIYLAKNKKEEFKKLIFSAKYVNGLKSVLGNKTINAGDFTEKIFNEFNVSLQNTIDLLKDMIENSEVKTSKHFTDKYFAMNQQSIVNTMELIDDLSKCKEFFNKFPEKI
ncbi:MAG: hypothetical protein LH629_14475 [Ignavibacteria bacterium]|nr:hypothetical protein [Ignavibacteria bacterium]